MKFDTTTQPSLGMPSSSLNRNFYPSAVWLNATPEKQTPREGGLRPVHSCSHPTCTANPPCGGILVLIIQSLGSLRNKRLYRKLVEGRLSSLVSLYDLRGPSGKHPATNASLFVSHGRTLSGRPSCVLAGRVLWPCTISKSLSQNTRRMNVSLTNKAFFMKE